MQAVLSHLGALQARLEHLKPLCRLEFEPQQLLLQHRPSRHKAGLALGMCHGFISHNEHTLGLHRSEYEAALQAAALLQQSEIGCAGALVPFADLFNHAAGQGPEPPFLGAPLPSKLTALLSLCAELTEELCRRLWAAWPADRLLRAAVGLWTLG